MTKDQMTKLVERQLDAYNRRDLEAFSMCFHSEICMTYLLSGETRCKGKEQFERLSRQLFDSSPSLQCTIKSRIILEGSIIDEELVTGSSRFPDGLHTVAIYGFRDGLIDRVWFART